MNRHRRGQFNFDLNAVLIEGAVASKPHEFFPDHPWEIEFFINVQLGEPVGGDFGFFPFMRVRVVAKGQIAEFLRNLEIGQRIRIQGHLCRGDFAGLSPSQMFDIFRQVNTDVFVRIVSYQTAPSTEQQARLDALARGENPIEDRGNT